MAGSNKASKGSRRSAGADVSASSRKAEFARVSRLKPDDVKASDLPEIQRALRRIDQRLKGEYQSYDKPRVMARKRGSLRESSLTRSGENYGLEESRRVMAIREANAMARAGLSTDQRRQTLVRRRSDAGPTRGSMEAAKRAFRWTGRY
jgi:hypothetical protein